jgi:hypothetical protein
MYVCMEHVNEAIMFLHASCHVHIRMYVEQMHRRECTDFFGFDQRTLNFDLCTGVCINI